jgi:hypothetical protein
MWAIARVRFARPQRKVAARQIETLRIRLWSKMWNMSSARIVRLLLAPALGLWIAGVGCMFGCENMVAAAGQSGTKQAKLAGHSLAIIATGDACSPAKSHNCCAKSKSKSQHNARPTKTSNTTLIASDQSSSSEMMGCPLAVNATAVVTKSSSKQVATPAALPNSTLPGINLQEQNASLSTPARLPNRGHTYLRCCVFLI